MVPGVGTPLQDIAPNNDGIMAQQNASHDHADAGARHHNDAPEGMQGNAHAEDLATDAMEDTSPSHPGTVNEDTGRRKVQA